MRKYFLLSAVALMAASTANATDGASNLTASATIIEPTIIECTPIDFGTMYFKVNPSTGISGISMDSSGRIPSGSATNVKYNVLFDVQGTPGTCTGLPDGATFVVSDKPIYLNDAKTIYTGRISYEDGKLTGVLKIEPDAVLDGSALTGSAVLLFTYE